MLRTQYCSAGLSASKFDELGSCHAHVDGGEGGDDGVAATIKIIQALERIGCPGMINGVSKSIAGPQRQLHPETYRAHTPTRKGVEVFEFFSSHLLPHPRQIVPALNEIMSRLEGMPGRIVEVEQVIAWRDPAEWRQLAEAQMVRELQGRILFPSCESLPVEFHHYFHLDGPRVDLEELLEFCNTEGVDVGGWFIFDGPGPGPDRFGYSSNAFTDSSDVRGLVEREREALGRFLKQKRLGCELITLVEAVVGIWKPQES